MLKLSVCKQQTLLSDIDVEISVSPQLQIKSDKTIKQMSLEETQNEKQLTVNKVQNPKLDKKASTGNRRRLFGQKDTDFMGGASLSGLTTKIPQVPRNMNPADMPYGSAVDKANIMA